MIDLTTSTARSARRSLAALLLALVGLGAAAPDPGIVLVVARDGFALVAHDARSDSPGPTLRVVLGSPAHPTPPGDYPLRRVILNPAWRPGPRARAAGAEPLGPSSDGPMGMGKIPFAARGAIALHGGAERLLVGKAVSNGCVRLTDADLGRLLDWLGERGALGVGRPTPQGELHRLFRRAVRLRIL